MRDQIIMTVQVHRIDDGVRVDLVAPSVPEHELPAFRAMAAALGDVAGRITSGDLDLLRSHTNRTEGCRASSPQTQIQDEASTK